MCADADVRALRSALSFSAHVLMFCAQTMKASLIRRKARNEKYERAVTAWKQHSEELESKVKEQNAEIQKLRPNEKKFRNQRVPRDQNGRH